LLRTSRRDFNEEVTRAIDAALLNTVGENVSRVLYNHLKDQYGIGRDEVPYRLPTIYPIMETMFELYGAKSVGSVIAKKLYSQLGLRFVEHSNYTVQDYIEEALKLHPNSKPPNFTVTTEETKPHSSHC